MSDSPHEKIWEAINTNGKSIVRLETKQDLIDKRVGRQEIIWIGIGVSAIGWVLFALFNTVGLPTS